MDEEHIFNIKQIGERYIICGARLIERSTQDAENLLKRGLIYNPTEAIGWYNAGICYHVQGKIEKAIKCYENSLNINKDLREAKENLAQEYLLIGNYKKGLALYEERIGSMGKRFNQFFNMFGRPWDGHDDKRKMKRLLIVSEQGFGDTIQFSRFILILQRLGIEVELFCEPELNDLIKNGTEIKNVTSRVSNDGLPTLWCPLMSVPHKLKEYDKCKYDTGVYLKSRKRKKEEWSFKLRKKEGNKLIGIHWQGNVSFENSIYSKGRSVPYYLWNMLKGVKGVEYVCLQKGEHMEKREELNEIEFTEGNTLFERTFNFEDTAGVIECCDLIITSDSCVAHLAGAMGKETLLLLSYVPEWRWGMEGTRTHWYRRTKLIRQEASGDWKGVMGKVRNEIIRLIKE